MAERPVLRSSEDQPPSDDFSSDLMPPDDPGRTDGQPLDHASDVIIRSKVRPPVLRESTLTRQRLLDWLNHHADDRVRVLAAEAGFGKTTLLTDWAKRTTRTVRWLKLDPVDAEWASFISYVIAAFQEGAPSFGAASLRMLGHVASLGITRDQVTGQLLAELGAVITKSTVLIIDDLQHVQGNADIQVILERLIERAPQQLTFILSGRSRPDVRLGRLTAQGSVAAIGTDELRFTVEETRDLFAKAYRMPLEGDLIDVVDARTEGWGASLQLLFSSIRGQRPAQVRDFIESLEGHRQPLYDFLAEEVLGRQPQLTQTILLHAAILERIVPSWVNAALSVLDEPPDPRTVLECLQQSDDLGFMSRSAELSASRRFHPLMREFMASHLAATTPPATLLAMHRRVAEASEATHWPTSAHHFIEAGDGDRAMAVIGDASITALGTGDWGAAIALLDRIPHVEPSIAVQVIRARGKVGAGDTTGALELLAGYRDRSDLSARDRALVRLTTAAALTNSDGEDQSAPILRELAEDPETPPLLGAVARAWFELHTPDSPRLGAMMQQVAILAAKEHLYLYAAIAHHNAAIVWLYSAEPEKAIVEAEQALLNFGLARHDEGLEACTRAVIAQGAFDLGDFARCRLELRRIRDLASIQADAEVEAAILHAWMGEIANARVCLARARATAAVRDLSGVATDVVRAAGAVVELVDGRPDVAFEMMAGMRPMTIDPNNDGVQYVVRTIATALARPLELESLASDYLSRTLKRRVHRWVPHLRLSRAIAIGDKVELKAASTDQVAYPDAVLLALADIIARNLSEFDGDIDRISTMIRRWPARWRPALRNGLLAPETTDSRQAAALLAEFGEASDYAAIVEWEQRVGKVAKSYRYSSKLARRVSPTLRIHDLGRCRLAIGDRELALTGVRRRAASLLLFLVSRPRQVATREQVFEALWPEQDLDQAGNSLHQTLFFLRRELVSKSSQGKPMVEYVPVEGELISLDRDLVHIESAAFERQIKEAAKDLGGHEVTRLLQSYEGQFAPEFQYEDWAMPWRDQTHGAFLELSERAARARMTERPSEAAAILRHALGVDPDAMALKPLMIAALALSGSEAAAQRLYRQYSEDYEEEFGEKPASYAETVRAPGRTDR